MGNNFYFLLYFPMIKSITSALCAVVVVASIAPVAAMSVEAPYPMPERPDYDSMVQPGYFYPNVLYPNMNQMDMYHAAIALEKKNVETHFGAANVIKIDAAIAWVMAKSKTMATTKEGQAMYIGEIISKIQNIQNIYGGYSSNPSPVVSVLNYIWYRLSVEMLTMVYGTGADIDSILGILQ